jgi:hypothetical protein
MQDQFAELRSYIFATNAERDRFRKLVVNAVISTDIAEKQRQSWRKSRWDKAFHSAEGGDRLLTPVPKEHLTNYKATIVFEYIIQASDVAHTMLNCKLFIKWKERLFQERFAACLPDGLVRIRPKCGSTMRFGFVTITLFPWPTN